MKKIFLTGSTGYLGTKFIELYGLQFEIFGVARTDANHLADMMDFEKVRKLFLECQPDFVLHMAADLGRDETTSDEIIKTNPAVTNNLLELAKINQTPFIFTSTEAVYGGKPDGNYLETDDYKPRKPYGVSKVECEKLVINSGLPYLITRGHRHVGISKNYHRPKQFCDVLDGVVAGKVQHLDDYKLFTPVLINNVCDIFAHYINHDSHKQILINMGIEPPTTFYKFMKDVVETLGLDTNLVKPDGEEDGWLDNNGLNVERLRSLQYPYVNYEEALATIKADY